SSLAFLARTGLLLPAAERERQLDRQRRSAAAHYVKTCGLTSQRAHQLHAGVDRRPPRLLLAQPRIAVEVRMRRAEVSNAVLQVGRHRLALDRQHAEKHAQSQPPRAPKEAPRDFGVENRLRDHELGAGRRLAFEQLELALEVPAIGI